MIKINGKTITKIETLELNEHHINILRKLQVSQIDKSFWVELRFLSNEQLIAYWDLVDFGILQDVEDAWHVTGTLNQDVLSLEQIQELIKE